MGKIIDTNEMLRILEGLMFICGEDGVTIEQVGYVLDLELEDAEELLELLRDTFEEEHRGLKISNIYNTYKVMTAKEHAEYYQKLIKIPTTKLSGASLEILSIVAYKQPVTRIEIEKIRGVSCDVVMRKLLALGLVKEAGRAKTVGRPKLYKTSDEFLDYFGLTSIEELPELLIDYSDLEKEMDQNIFDTRYREDVSDETDEDISVDDFDIDKRREDSVLNREEEEDLNQGLFDNETEEDENDFDDSEFEDEDFDEDDSEFEDEDFNEDEFEDEEDFDEDELEDEEK